jgi:hypothetical protein
MNVKSVGQLVIIPVWHRTCRAPPSRLADVYSLPAESLMYYNSELGSQAVGDQVLVNSV